MADNKIIIHPKSAHIDVPMYSRQTNRYAQYYNGKNNGLFHITPNTPAKRIVHGIQYWHVEVQELPLKKWAIHITLHACLTPELQQKHLIKIFDH